MSVLEHVFSIEIESKRFVKNISLSDEAHENVLFEGTLGETLEISLLEGDVFEIVGSHGAIRISITLSQLVSVLEKQGLIYTKEKKA